jgi:hypothetical protein
VFRHVQRHAGAWLIALAAWLPLSQLAGVAHALSHLSPASSSSPSRLDDGIGGADEGVCVLCLAAAAGTDAAPAPVLLPPVPNLVAFVGVLPPSTPAPAPTWQPFLRSRAPPLASLR